MERLRKRVALAGARLGATVLKVLLTSILLVVAGPPAGAAGAFVVIVNTGNPVSVMSLHEISNAFMKRVPRWPNGDEVAPVDLKEQSAVREAFSHEIHERSTAAVKAYWQKMIFSGRGVPPPEKATGAEVVAWVGANRGGIGYVAGETALGDGVKALKVTQ